MARSQKAIVPTKLTQAERKPPSHALNHSHRLPRGPFACLE
jgi:hypothetical protein